MDKTDFVVWFLIGLIIILILFVRVPYNPPDIIRNIKEKISYIDPRFAKFDIRESNDKSYTENKSTVYLCTKDPKTSEYYSDNTLIYVVLHECAHMIDPKHNDGHDDSYKQIFKNLLNKAESLGLYNSKVPIPPTYCGLN